MVCDEISSIECSVLLASQQDVKLLFIVIYYIAFIFIWYFFNKKRIDNIAVQYYAWPVLTSKWCGFLYFFFSPVHILLYASNVSQEIALGWFALFYIPIVTIILLMPILMAFDRIFILFGYSNTFDFVKKYRRKQI